MAKVIKIGNIKIKVPDDIDIHESINLDVLYGTSCVRRSDVLLIFSYKGLKYTAIIEDTGRPKPRDFERINQIIQDLKCKNIIPRKTILIKLVHHTGIKSGKSLISRLKISYRIMLQECIHRYVDLESILRSIE